MSEDQAADKKSGVVETGSENKERDNNGGTVHKRAIHISSGSYTEVAKKLHGTQKPLPPKKG